LNSSMYHQSITAEISNLSSQPRQRSVIHSAPAHRCESWVQSEIPNRVTYFTVKSGLTSQVAKRMWIPPPRPCPDREGLVRPSRFGNILHPLDVGRTIRPT
jgi:hypothetical protein